MNANKYAVPGVLRIKGCYLHYAQSRWLSVQYKLESDVRTWFRKLMALPFIPVPQVADDFTFIKCEEFHIYFLNTWNDGRYQGAMWNFFKYGGPPTNNHVEGRHTCLIKKTRKSHPNIFEVVRQLTHEEASALVQIVQLET